MKSPFSDGFSDDKKWFSDAWSNDIRFSFAVEEILHDEVSEFQHIHVVKTKSLGRMLILDGHLQTAENDEAGYHEMITHTGLCRKQAPEKMRVLIVGGGDGGVAREALKHDFVSRVDLVDIDQSVMNAAKQFLPTLWPPSLDKDKRFFTHAQDAFAFLRELNESERYDHIVVDASDPIGPGTVLYSDAFYKSVSAALNPRGSVSVQAGSAHYFPEILQVVFQGLKKHLPHVSAYECFTKIYPGGVWNLVLATKSGDDPSEVDASRARKLRGCDFYSEHTHKAAFALSPRARRVLATPAPSLASIAQDLADLSQE